MRKEEMVRPGVAHVAVAVGFREKHCDAVELPVGRWRLVHAAITTLAASLWKHAAIVVPD